MFCSLNNEFRVLLTAILNRTINHHQSHWPACPNSSGDSTLTLDGLMALERNVNKLSPFLLPVTLLPMMWIFVSSGFNLVIQAPSLVQKLQQTTDKKIHNILRDKAYNPIQIREIKKTTGYVETILTWILLEFCSLLHFDLPTCKEVLTSSFTWPMFPSWLIPRYREEKSLRHVAKVAKFFQNITWRVDSHCFNFIDLI